MSLAPLCRFSICKSCGAIIDFMYDYCGEDYFDKSKDGLCLKQKKTKRRTKPKQKGG